MTHTEDLIARLRDTASRGVSSWGDLQQEAADELETLMNAVAAEPVAWGVFEGNLHDMYFTEEDAQELARLKGTHAEVRPLYAAPPLPVQPQRPWVGLTDEELHEICNSYYYGDRELVKLIEAKLKEKNNG